MTGISAHRISLLENGDEFFPAVFRAIGNAAREVLLETFILAEDDIGEALRHHLIAAAHRGVRVLVTADGYGSAPLTDDFVQPMTAAGIRVRLYDPRPRFLSFRTNLFRRLHSKLVVIDSERAFVGGINFSAEHMCAIGMQSKQDYAVEIEGPVCEQIRVHMLRTPAADFGELLPELPMKRPPAAPTGRPAGLNDIAFVVRDNGRFPTEIERHYLLAIRTARARITIANAYFFPGFRLLRTLRAAARRGVDVRLILQGRADLPLVRAATRALYDYLLSGNVRIYEYEQRTLHAKVAVIDDRWSTVGSSNLDPLSLFLNLEANLVIRDGEFAGELEGRLQHLINAHCREVAAGTRNRLAWGRSLVSFLAFHLVRRLPQLAGWLPAHTSQAQVVRSAAPPPSALPEQKTPTP